MLVVFAWILAECFFRQLIQSIKCEVGVKSYAYIMSKYDIKSFPQQKILLNILWRTLQNSGCEYFYSYDKGVFTCLDYCGLCSGIDSLIDT